MLDVSSELRRLPELSASTLAALVLGIAIATILAALGFQHLGGYDPCPMCFQQRYAYYLGIPAVAVALIVLRSQPKAAAALLALVAIGFLVTTAIAIYQAGAEWKFWDPPATCSAAAELPSFDVNNLDVSRKPAVCGIASWRFLGLSFAGWNAVISAMLAAGALTAAVKTLRKRG